jgi:N-acetylneuraminic acid mutarotase
VDNFLYVIGGWNGKILSSCERYDISKNSWSSIPDLSCARSKAGVASMEGQIFAIGGHCGKNTVEAFDPRTNSWHSVASMNESRFVKEQTTN